MHFSKKVTWPKIANPRKMWKKKPMINGWTKAENHYQGNRCFLELLCLWVWRERGDEWWLVEAQEVQESWQGLLVATRATPTGFRLICIETVNLNYVNLVCLKGILFYISPCFPVSIARLWRVFFCAIKSCCKRRSAALSYFGATRRSVLCF